MANNTTINLKRWKDFWTNEIVYVLRYGTTLYTFYTDDEDEAVSMAVDVINGKEHIF